MTTTIRLDDDLKRSCDAILEDMGLNFSVAVTAFAKELVRRRAMPFELRAGMPPRHISKEDAMRNFEEMRAQALKANPNGMTLEEINAEIAAARAERKARLERETAST